MSLSRRHDGDGDGDGNDDKKRGKAMSHIFPHGAAVLLSRLTRTMTATATKEAAR
ncbi:MAG: hypothetical protein MPK62_13680 [Alphaproteobacteria bacterium]|nr:hypothetical protein [Alphaproteobacteria bacterium]